MTTARRSLVVLSSIGSTLGLTGALYALGYVVEKATEDYLGVATSSGATSDYLQASGEFLFVTVTEGIRVLLDGEVFPGWTIAIVTLGALMLLGALVIWARVRRRTDSAAGTTFRPRLRVGLWVGACLVLTVTAVFWTLRFAAPTFYVGNLLSRSSTLTASPPFEGLRGRAGAERFWHSVVCSRVTPATEPQCGDRGVESASGGRSEIRDDTAKRVHVARLRRHFLVHAAGSLVVFVAAFWLLSCSALWTRSFDLGVVAVVLVTAVLIDLGTVPYVYAKTVRSTQRKLIRIHRIVDNTITGDVVEDRENHLLVRVDGPYYKGGTWRVSKSRIHAVYRVKPNLAAVTVQYEGEGRIEENHGWLIAESERTITILDSADHFVWEVPRVKTSLIAVEGLSDVLEHRLKFNYAASSQPANETAPLRP